MPKPYDAVSKELIEAGPRDWAMLSGQPIVGDFVFLDTDLSTVSAQADKVIKVFGPEEHLRHFEFQSGPDPFLIDRLLFYNVSLGHSNHCAVDTTLILLRPAADSKEYTGLKQYKMPEGRCYLEFHYNVVRVWELSVENILTGGLGTLPLAPVSDVTKDALPGVMQKLSERFEKEVPPDKIPIYWTATYVLMGLRYPQDFIAQLVPEESKMKESVTYQAIVEEGVDKGREEGREEGRESALQGILLKLGSRRMGPPDPSTLSTLQGIHNPNTLEELIELSIETANWQELLANYSERNGH